MTAQQRTSLMVAGVFVLFAAVYLAGAMRQRFGTADQPGPGVYPTLMGLLMLGASLGLALQAWLGKQGAQEPIEWPTGKALWRMLAVGGASAGYIVLMPYLGDALAGVLVMLLVMRVMGVKRWLVAGALAVGMAVTFHYVFVEVLSIPLPRGILFPFD